MRRILWSAIGLFVGAVAMRAILGPGRRLSPKELADSAIATFTRLSELAGGFVTDVRQGMAEHEAALREAAELDSGRLDPAVTA